MRSGAAALLRLCGLSAVLGFSACGGSGEDPTAADPERVFRDGFLSPLSGVVIEGGSGTVVRGYDAWLRLLPHGGLKPRYEAEFRDRDCAQLRAFFQEKFDARWLSPVEMLVCREYSDPRFAFDNGRWLVEDGADGRVYFRAWKRY